MTKMEELEEAEYIKFMDYVAVQLVKLPSSRSIQGKGQHCIYLRVDVREVLVRILMRYIRLRAVLLLPCAGNYTKLSAMGSGNCKSSEGLGDINAREIGRAAYKRFMHRNSGNMSSIVASISSYDCARFNSSQFPVIEGIKYSIAGDDPFWQGATLFMTISGTILHIFYASVIYMWLISHCRLHPALQHHESGWVH